MPLVFLPWIAAVLFTAGYWAALNFFVYAIVVLAVGYGIISAALPGSARIQAIFLASAVGILAVSALTAFWLRLGLPITWAPAFWLGLMAVGAVCLWKDRVLWAKNTVAYGGTLAVFSALICAVYFLPGARNDAVQRQDGSFNWIYVDTEYFHSMAAGIKRGDSPPKAPGTATAELLYHFGAYAPAAAISRLDGLDLGDAFARVTRGASIWALVLSCFGLGTLLSLKATDGRFGGIMSVAGLFFYGSLLSLFTDHGSPTKPILFKIPEVDVVADGGPFSHLILGHSVVHGLIAITAIMGLSLAQREWGTIRILPRFILLILPAFAVGMNSVAALYCIGVAGILLFWGRLGDLHSWLQIALLFCLFLGAWKLMGYSHAPDVGLTTLNTHPTWEWWRIVIWFVIGLGFRIVGFRWITRPLRDPMSALVAASVIGLLLFSLSLQIDGNQRYGLYFLQSMFSIFAFSRLRPRFWRGTERFQLVSFWLKVAKQGLLFLGACGILIGIYGYATHSVTHIDYFRIKILLPFLLFGLLAGTAAIINRDRSFSRAISAILMGLLMIGFLGWISPWLDYGMGRGTLDITLTSGEVWGLHRLNELSAPGELFATNKHVPTGPAFYRVCSYAYDTLSERPVLLEGYLYHGVQRLPWFKILLHDNDLMFTTTDPEKLRDIARTWHVRWLVARPGTDIALPRPLPSWLVEQPNSGDLKIYRIN
jgi:hypothetical protein